MNTDDPDTLFRTYVNELAYLKNAGGNFAKTHPKLARRLELGPEGSADPQIERLLESFAFLSARLQREIDADFPRIPAALLDTLYPHLTAPVPSMAIARFDVDPEQSRACMGIHVPRQTQLFAQAEDGMTCRFRTNYDVRLWPVRVNGVDMLSPHHLAQSALDRQHTNIATILRVRLCCIGKRDFTEFAPQTLRFYIDADHATAEMLYEVLNNRVTQIWLQPEGQSAQPTDIRISPVGFDRDEAVLPYPAGTHQGYRLLQEYFTFPQKFLFVDLNHLPPMGEGASADLLFLLKSRPPAGMVLEPDTLRLGCTPMINLFERTSDPIRLDHTRVEYRLTPDIRQERATEVYAIEKITDTAANNRTPHIIQPFYAVNHTHTDTAPDCYWIARRVPSERPDLPGTQMMLSFKDHALHPADPRSPVLFAHTLCTNRSVAEQIPAGSRLEIEQDLPVSAIVCQTRPTPQIPPPEDGESLWQLVSHLSVNHLSLSNSAEGLSALKEILRLYGGLRGVQGHQMIDSLTAMTTRPIVRRMGRDAWRGFCRGLEVSLQVNDETVGSQVYLFATVLSYFFGLYCGINMFTQLVVRNPRLQEGVWATWPPRSGDAILL